MILKDTLLVRHLPSELTNEEKASFLKHFGAVKVKILGPETKRNNLVYARFETHAAAEVALKRLHQLELLGHYISAEFARSQHDDTNYSSVRSRIVDEKSGKEKTKRYYDNFLQKLNCWTKIADFNQPPPVHLIYQYSPPTRQILINICKAMASVPKFYTQVLHLMNKMNLPCPFTEKYSLHSDLFPENEISVEDADGEELNNKSELTEQKQKESDEEESEIESDRDDNLTRANEVTNVKRTVRQKKVVKRPKFVKPVLVSGPSKPALTPDEVFEKVNKETIQRKIQLNLTVDLSSIQEAKESQNSADTVIETFGMKHSTPKIACEKEKKETECTEIKDDTGNDCISAEDLASNRISQRDQRVLPVFKKYQPGAPSCRLYIKNLAKQVTVKDLHYIYRRFLISDLEEQGLMFDIRLMQEGRMKGQAFVTLQSTEQAQKALKETNGYILKDKPMVVQFARSAVTK